MSDTASLEDWVLKVREYKERHPSLQVYPIIRFPVDDFKHPTTGFGRPGDRVILKANNKSFVTKIEKREGHLIGISYSPDPRNAMVISREEAEGIIMRNPHFRFEIGSAKIVSKPNNVIIRFGTGKLTGYYYYGSSRNGFRYTSVAESAKRFADESAAKRTMARLKDYNPELTTV